MVRRVAPLVLLVAALALTGCGVGTDGGDGQAMADDLQQANATWLGVDLTDGSTTVLAVAPVEDESFRRTRICLRYVPGGTMRLGSRVGDTGAQADESTRTVTTGPCFMAMYEMTRAQWTALAGTRPWEEVPAGVIAATADDLLPATNISLADIAAALARRPLASGWRLDLPTDDEWEAACRAGSDGLFAWGDVRVPAVAASHAVVRETLGAVSGARTVGGRQANALGLCDMHGNVWEWTSSGQARGGSWNDGLLQARAANRLEPGPADRHALIGLRLVLRR